LTVGTAENYRKSQSGYSMFQPGFEMSASHVQDEEIVWI
jgi:hypothetical protein